jgi:glycosyltransferase involved in cell wall biosynthesis
VAAAVEPLIREIPNAIVVFAYRHKSPRAAERAQVLQQNLSTVQVRFIAEVPDMHALLALSSALLFPVDDLYGKVDLPIVLLEAMQLGVPVVALDRGPLADLEGVLRVAPGDAAALADLAIRLIRDQAFKQSIVVAQHEAIERKHRPTQIAERYEAIYDDLLARRK